MRIRWNGEAAQEMLVRLERTEQYLRQCLEQSVRVWEALEEANSDGDNRALKNAQERYQRCERRLREFAEMLESYQSALKRADELFDETERRIARDTDSLEEIPERAVFMESGARVRWDASAYMPSQTMRVSTLTPVWLEKAVEEADASILM